MKIAILINLFTPKWLAGTEIATYYLAEQLAKKGHEIHVITSYDEGLPIFQKGNGFCVHRLAWPKIRIIGILSFWMKILFKIYTIKPDIVHSQDLSMGIPAYVVKIILKKPYVVWGRGSDVYLPGLFMRICNGSILRNADAILALTEDMRKKMTEMTSREIYVLPNGIKLEQFPDISLNMRKKEGIKNILFVGSLYPIKGVQYLIMAMKIVHNKMPETRLILVGDGEDRERLEALSIQLDIKKNVQFVGKVPHEKVQSYMHQADVFVLPSLSEGLPNVILEAMACGLPVVATRVGGVPDIIQDRVHGYLVESENADDIARKLIMILNNNSIASEFSLYNRKTVKKYEYENIIIQFENILIKIIEDKNELTPKL